MLIRDVLFAPGSAGHFHIDVKAIGAGAAVADGFNWKGAAMTPGFSRIVEPAESLSILLVLEDGQTGFGDCVDVCYAGSAGREPPFHPNRMVAVFGGAIRDRLIGRNVGDWLGLAAECDAAETAGARWPAAIRYGLSQALLHVAALASRKTMANLICEAFGLPRPDRSPALLSCTAIDDHETLDRTILKRVDILPHTYITNVERHLGANGEALIGHVKRIAARVRSLGGEDYRPALQFDMNGQLSFIVDKPNEQLIDYLERLADAAAPYVLRIECPWLADRRADQIEIYVGLTAAVRQRGGRVLLGVDEWCNTREDFDAFAAAGAGDYLHIKMPDLGSITNSMQAIASCRRHAMGAFLGGSINATDQSARVSAHVGLAFQPDALEAKPGLGGDEAIMIVRNEIARALVLTQLRFETRCTAR
jgi:methylaspartate ammonia-lyase